MGIVDHCKVHCCCPFVWFDCFRFLSLPGDVIRGCEQRTDKETRAEEGSSIKRPLVNPTQKHRVVWW